MGSTGVATTLALASGVAGSIQIAALGALGQRIGELEAAAFAFALTALAGFLLLLVARRGVDAYTDALSAPAWMWLGGLTGVLIVISVVVAGPRIGVLATSALLITGQLSQRPRSTASGGSAFRRSRSRGSESRDWRCSWQGLR